MIQPLLLLSLLHTLSADDVTDARHDDVRRYAVIIDAGSSGSRLRIFGWDNLHGLPKNAREMHTYKTNPGISEYVNDLYGLRDHVQKMLDESINFVPRDKHKVTPVYLMATAGMRLILEEKAYSVMEYLENLLMNATRNPFLFERRNCRILSGEEEGVFMWIAANYLRGFFTKKVSDSVGILELGGASMQIAFQTDGPLLADKFPVLVEGELYELYVHSYLYYGQDFTRKWILDYIVQQDPKNTDFSCPCFLKGDFAGHELDDNRVVNFTGGGDADACKAILEEFVYEADPDRCFPKPCAIGTVYQPTIPKDKIFFAVSAFVYSAQVLHIADKDGQIKLDKFDEATRTYCAKDLDAVAKETGIKKEYLSKYCMTGTYMPVLFIDGFGFPADSANIYVKDEINGIAAEWPLGALVYENELQPYCAAAPSVRSTIFTTTITFLASVFLYVNNISFV